MLRQFLLRTLKCLLVACFICTNTQAGQSDFDKPISVTSDWTDGDGKKETTKFKGNVVISQGSLEIKADSLTFDASKGKGNEVLIIKGNPATYAQTLDDGGKVSARANEIFYSVTTKVIQLMGNAELVDDDRSISGAAISYNMLSERLEAEKSTDSKKRVTVVFKQPKKSAQP